MLGFPGCACSVSVNGSTERGPRAPKKNGGSLQSQIYVRDTTDTKDHPDRRSISNTWFRCNMMKISCSWQTQMLKYWRREAWLSFALLQLLHCNGENLLASGISESFATRDHCSSFFSFFSAT